MVGLQLVPKPRQMGKSDFPHCLLTEGGKKLKELSSKTARRVNICKVLRVRLGEQQADA